jgi:hypothetical protein
MTIATSKVDVPDTAKLSSNGKARIYRILRLRPSTSEEVATVTSLDPGLVGDVIAELFAAGLIVKMRRNRFFSRAYSIWRYHRPQQRYLIGMIIGAIFLPLGLSEVASFLFVPGAVLLGAFVSLFT